MNRSHVKHICEASNSVGWILYIARGVCETSVPGRIVLDAEGEPTSIEAALAPGIPDPGGTCSNDSVYPTGSWQGILAFQALGIPEADRGCDMTDPFRAAAVLRNPPAAAAWSRLIAECQ